jgi:hypothetical protein
MHANPIFLIFYYEATRRYKVIALIGLFATNLFILVAVVLLRLLT